MVYAGPAAARDFWADATDAWSQLRVDIEEQRDLDGRVLTLGTLHGRARHTGAEVETRAAWVSTFNAGEQIVELHTYPSEEAALVALGLGDDVDLVRRAVEAAARRPPDWETVNALYHPAHEFIPLLTRVEGGSYVGADGFQRWRDQMDEMGDWHPEVGDVRPVSDGHILVISRLRGQAHRSGVPLDVEFGSLVSVRAGRIVRTEIFGSPAEALQVVGQRE